MKTDKILVSILIAFSTLFTVQVCQADETEIKETLSKAQKEASTKEEAVGAAKAWLGLVDQGDYAESWKQTAEYFRKAVTQDQWLQSMTAYREPLGKVIFRTLKSSNYTEALPGAPDGKYVVILFNTSFENKKSAVETVTPMLCKDGTWRVSGYYIK